MRNIHVHVAKTKLFKHWVTPSYKLPTVHAILHCIFANVSHNVQTKRLTVPISNMNKGCTKNILYQASNLNFHQEYYSFDYIVPDIYTYVHTENINLNGP